MKKHEVQETFETGSLVTVACLCVLTFGLYVIFRLYQLSIKVNPWVREPIPTWFMNLAVGIHLLSFFSLVVFFAFDVSETFLLFLKMMHLISSVFHLIWIIKVRNRINELNGVVKGDTLWLNPFLSSFFHVIYMQYKINQTATR